MKVRIEALEVMVTIDQGAWLLAKGNKMNMLIGRFFMAIFVSLFVFDIEAFACACAEVTLTESKKDATVVFSGKIIRKIKSESVEKSGVEVTFQVDRVWKGSVGPTIKIYSGATSDLYDFMDSCSPDFGLDDVYIIFAKGDKLLSNMICSHTTRVNVQVPPKVLLDQLGQGKRPRRKD